MKILRRIVRFLDRLTDAGLLVFFLLLFAMGSYALYDSALVYMDANDTSLLKYKPGYEKEEPEKEIKGNMTAWITLDDTDIDYPVMQGDDNSEYLNKDPYGEYSLSGSIFLDSRNASDFSDPYSLIYGHHMEHGAMFGALDDFLDEDYFSAHRTGTLYAGDDVYRIQVFGVLECAATQEEIFAPTEIPLKDTARYITQKAMYLDEKAWDKDQKILALSTCKYPDTADRTVVLTTIEKENSHEKQ